MANSFEGITAKGIYGNSWKTVFKDLKKEISEDNLTNGAAALAYFLMLAIFPAMIFLLSLLPYLPIDNLEQAILDLLDEVLPGETAASFTGTIQEVVGQKREGLISVGALLTIWAASNGMFAVMRQLNITYDVEEGRPFWKARGISILLTFGFGALVISAFALIILGGELQTYLANTLGWGEVILTFFATLRWVIIAAAITLAFAVTYYFGPDVDQKFKYITPGSVLGVFLLIGASLAFKLYVENFGSYNATYGSIGAIIVLLLWLNIMGLVVLLGSEVNALIEHYSPEGKDKGNKNEFENNGKSEVLSDQKDNFYNNQTKFPYRQQALNHRSKLVQGWRHTMEPNKNFTGSSNDFSADEYSSEDFSFNSSTSGGKESIASILREITMSLKNLVTSEMSLIKAEVKDSAHTFQKNMIQAGIAVGILSLSVLPFLAFLVIGLGEILNNFWLSSLIVAVVFGAVGGVMSMKAFKKIKQDSFKLEHTLDSFQAEKSAVSQNVESMKNAMMRGHVDHSRTKSDMIFDDEQRRAG